MSSSPRFRVQETPGDYRYRNTRPLSVILLSMLAAASAGGAIVGAHRAIDGAMAAQVIGSPPDLKKVIEGIERDSRAAYARVVAAD